MIYFDNFNVLNQIEE